MQVYIEILKNSEEFKKLKRIQNDSKEFTSILNKNSKIPNLQDPFHINL